MIVITYATGITLLRLVLVIPLGVALCNQAFGLSFLIMLLAGVTDLLDGYIARRYQQETMFGALLDPLADKVLLITTCIILAAQGMLPGWFMVIILVKELMLLIGAAFLFFLKRKVVMARPYGKWAMDFQVSYCLLLFFTRYTNKVIPCITSLSLWGVTLVTFIALVDYVGQGFQALIKQ